MFDRINNYVIDKFTDLKRATGNWYINYYYQKYGKNYVAFKIDSKQDGCNIHCLNIALYCKDVKNHFSDQEVSYYHINKKPKGCHKHGKFPYQASFTDISEITKAYELLEKIYNITKSQLEKY